MTLGAEPRPTRACASAGAALPEPASGSARPGGLRRRRRRASPAPARPYAAARRRSRWPASTTSTTSAPRWRRSRPRAWRATTWWTPLAGFRPLAHRLEPVGERDGVLFVNDSIATIPEATVAAARALAPRPDRAAGGGPRPQPRTTRPLADYLAGAERGGRRGGACRPTARRSSSPGRRGLRRADGGGRRPGRRRARAPAAMLPRRRRRCCCRRARRRGDDFARLPGARRRVPGAGRGDSEPGPDGGRGGRARPAKTHGPWPPPDPPRGPSRAAAPRRARPRRSARGRARVSAERLLSGDGPGARLLRPGDGLLHLQRHGAAQRRRPARPGDPPGRLRAWSASAPTSVFARMSPEGDAPPRPAGARRLGVPAAGRAGPLDRHDGQRLAALDLARRARPAPAVRAGEARPRPLDRPGGGAPARGACARLEGPGARSSS